MTVEPATKKTGIELLEETLSGLGQFIECYKKGVFIIFDEFQEIVELKESLQIEGVMRSHIQTHSNASCFFVGSRRRILSDIFNDRKRPFYRSSINYPLNPLPLDESVQFIIDQFNNGGKDCPADIAKRIVDTVQGYPYYIQRLPYSIFEVSTKKIKDDDYANGFRKAVDEEKPVFEALLQSLSLQQIKLLSALAEQPTASPYSAGYMSRYSLGSIGGIQGAVKKLIALDYIENRDNTFYIVDPVFGIWLKHLKGY